MLINNSKTRNPIAVWFLLDKIDINSDKKLPPPQDITLGWDNFRKKLQENNISLSDITDERWIEKPHNEHHYYDDFGRKKLDVGKYRIIDGNHSLKHKLNTKNNIEVSNLKITLFNGLSFLGKNKSFEKDDNLFFNAQPKYRDYILNGKQPLRTTRHYRRTDNHSGDQMEGITKKQVCYTNNINKIYTEILPNEAYIFSLHDNPDGIKKFGSDLFKINNICEWIEEVYTQVDNYWLQKRDDYVGCTIFFDKVIYSNDKKIEDLGLLTKDETSFFCRGFGIDVDTKINEPLVAVTYPLAKDFFKALEIGLLTKPEAYKDESEARLIITPLFSNMQDDGYFLNDFYEENLIEMNLERNFVDLVNKNT